MLNKPNNQLLIMNDQSKLNIIKKFCLFWIINFISTKHKILTKSNNQFLIKALKVKQIK